jgi:8-oxo-dGTP diphosphatase
MKHSHTTPDVSVDIVLLTLDEGRLKVALHRRERSPGKGSLALPGGYVHVDEDASMEATSNSCEPSVALIAIPAAGRLPSRTSR